MNYSPVNKQLFELVNDITQSDIDQKELTISSQLNNSNLNKENQDPINSLRVPALQIGSSKKLHMRTQSQNLNDTIETQQSKPIKVNSYLNNQSLHKEYNAPLKEQTNMRNNMYSYNNNAGLASIQNIDANNSFNKQYIDIKDQLKQRYESHLKLGYDIVNYTLMNKQINKSIQSYTQPDLNSQQDSILQDMTNLSIKENYQYNQVNQKLNSERQVFFDLSKQITNLQNDQYISQTKKTIEDLNSLDQKRKTMFKEYINSLDELINKYSDNQ